VLVSSSSLNDQKCLTLQNISFVYKKAVNFAHGCGWFEAVLYNIVYNCVQKHSISVAIIFVLIKSVLIYYL
jgi:hypothetical protein